MLRQFSIKRIFGFFLVDWLGTLGVLVWASSLRTDLGNLPGWLVNRLGTLQIVVGSEGQIISGNYIYKISVLVLVAIIWPIFFSTFSVYEGKRNPNLIAELRNVFVAACVSAVVLAGVLYLTYRETSRLFFLIFVCLDLLLLMGCRIVFYIYRSIVLKKNNVSQRKVLIVGLGEVGRNVVVQLKKYGSPDLQLIGFLDDDPRKKEQEFDHLTVLGTLDQAAEVAAAQLVQDAIIALPLRAHKRLVHVCTELQKLSVRVYVIPDIFALSFPNSTLDGFGGIPVIDLGLPGIQGKKRLEKRIFDIVIASILLVILSPLLLLIAILIKLDSPGPVIYKQQRIGEKGQLFTMFKFRSMHVNNDPTVHKKHISRLIQQNLSPKQLSGNHKGSLKIENDPRITRVGRVIRRASLDELPQLFNILRNEMSLVGPRPDVPYAVELYKDWHKRRFECPPGMTGWWQVKGHNRVSYDEMMRMDIYYIENMSLWLDIKIILLTPFEMIAGKGAG
jgi:exopolysaccharide biosynthesis polyprenyl glycosylphosphotransferase